MNRVTLWSIALGLAVLSLPVPGRAATITLSPRGNCSCITTGTPPVTSTIRHVYYSGSVTFSDPAHSLVLVECSVWVPWAGTWNLAGSQLTGFINVPPSTTWDYKKCATMEPRTVGSGPYTTKDKAYRYPTRQDPPGSGPFLVASGTAPWSP